MSTNNSIIDGYFRKFDDSQRAMAASIEALNYCEKLIKASGSSTILDCGSGASSVFFHSKFEQVLTVDDNSFWAETTSKYLNENLGVDLDIKPINTVKNQVFDFVFYDYGNMETRIYFFRKALELFKLCLYVDDMHVLYYREYVISRTQGYKLEYLPETTDEFGRYGALITRQ